MSADLAKTHEPFGVLPSAQGADPERFRLSDEQLAFWEENGYVSGIDILTDEDIEVLRSELKELMDPEHPNHELFHEFHLNESGDPDDVLFHALGAWRISKAFHDLIWHPGFTTPARQLLGGPVRFWHDQLFCKPPQLGTRTTRTGRGRNRWRI